MAVASRWCSWRWAPWQCSHAGGCGGRRRRSPARCGWSGQRSRCPPSAGWAQTCLMVHTQPQHTEVRCTCKFTFKFGAFGRRFFPKRLTKSTFVKGDSNISQCYIEAVHSSSFGRKCVDLICLEQMSNGIFIFIIFLALNLKSTNDLAPRSTDTPTNTDLPPWCVYRRPRFPPRSTGCHRGPQNQSENKQPITGHEIVHVTCPGRQAGRFCPTLIDSWLVFSQTRALAYLGFEATPLPAWCCWEF